MLIELTRSRSCRAQHGRALSSLLSPRPSMLYRSCFFSKKGVVVALHAAVSLRAHLRGNRNSSREGGRSRETLPEARLETVVTSERKGDVVYQSAHCCPTASHKMCSDVQTKPRAGGVRVVTAIFIQHLLATVAPSGAAISNQMIS